MASTSSLAELLSPSVLEVVGEEETRMSKRPRLQSEEERKECERLVLKNNNENTARSTNTWVNRFENWRIARGLPLPLLKIRHEDLDETLQLFYSTLVKADGQPYEPTSLRTMLAGLDRYFRDNGKTSSIQNDKEFERSRNVLNGKAIKLCELGKGKKPRRAHALTEQEELLWKNVFGCHTPESLNYTVYYTVSQQFGTRGRQEHHEIRMEDLKWVKDPDTDCTIYIEWTEGITKTRKGGLQKAERALKRECLPLVVLAVQLILWRP